MTEPPSAEAMKLASRHADGEVKKCAAEIDALIAQRISAETERWQNRDRQRLEQIERLQETVQSFQSARAERLAPDPLEQARQSGWERGIAAAAEYVEARPNEHPAVLAGLMRDLGSMYAAERPAPPQRHLTGGEREVMRAREIIGRSCGEVVDYIHGSEPLVNWRVNERLIVNIAAALSAVASERDAAAIRAFGKRVWSDTEEVAYQAGVSDTRARLREPDVRQAVKAALEQGRPHWITGVGPGGAGLGGMADAAIARIAEMLK